MKKYVCFIFLLVFLCYSKKTMADAPRCYLNSNNAGYCQYTGYVEKIYANANNQIILYFDTPMAAGEPGIAGIIGITVLYAGMIDANVTPEFAKYFYATALSAQSTNRRVTVQARGNIGGYVKIDRIWLPE